jgi:hypothetical protein
LPNNLEEPENRVQALQSLHPVFRDLLGIGAPFVKPMAQGMPGEKPDLLVI